MLRHVFNRAGNLKIPISKFKTLVWGIGISKIRACLEFRASDLECLLKMLVPRAGLEPAQSHDHEILSLARIPISPPRLKHAPLLVVKRGKNKI